MRVLYFIECSENIEVLEGESDFLVKGVVGIAVKLRNYDGIQVAAHQKNRLLAGRRFLVIVSTHM